MRVGGPTVGLLSDLGNMSGGVMAAHRLIPTMPRSSISKNMYNNTSSGLSLGLVPNLLEGGADMLPPLDMEVSGKIRVKEDEYESRSGSDNLEGGSGDEQDAEPPRKKRYHRHTPRQIQEMEAFFKQCPHPDDKQRQELSRELGLEPRQVKFWFQNRRTQMKTQQERTENTILKQENERLRAENITMKEAIRNASCPNCGGPSVLGEMSLDEQQLRIENARLKDELDRVSALAAKYLGRPITTLGHHHHQIMPSSSLELAVGGSFAISNLSGLSHLSDPRGDTEKAMLFEMALTAMEEFYRMCQPEESSWIPSPDGPSEVLNYDEYIRQYPSSLGPKPFGLKTEATRESGIVMMNAVTLVEILVDPIRWMETFPCIISRAGSIDVVVTGVPGNRNGAFQLMFSELQVLSPNVPTRELCFLRFCKQHDAGVWAVVDVSVDLARDATSSTRCRMRPSGFMIQEMPNGYSKVTVLQHMEYDDRMVNKMYKNLVNSGLAFGAKRWLNVLQRQCEKISSFLAANIPGGDSATSRLIRNVQGRKSMLKLAQRMTNNFYAGVSASSVLTWTTLSGNGENGVLPCTESGVRVATRKSSESPGEPPGTVLSAATSLWLPVSPQRLFEYLRDESSRQEWDILSNGGVVEEIAHIAKGPDPGNCVSLLQVNTPNCNASNMLIIQENCTDACGSTVVYAPVDIPAIDLVLQGGDSNYVALLPSGFAILPDGNDASSIQSQTDSERPARPGSLLTAAFQILVSTVPSAKLSLDSVNTVNTLITSTVQKIKVALQCDTA